MKKTLPSMFLTAVLWLMTGASANAQDSALERLTIQDGICQIGTVQDLATLAEAVAEGNTGLEVQLTADIDLRESETPNLMIGTQATPYAGKFDGQGHTVSYSYDLRDNYGGLFSFVSGATICNLRVEGDVVTRGIHFGALIGYGDGEMLVENVVTDVTIVGEHSGVTGNGGMIGALYGNITFTGCATLGEMGHPGSSMYCGFVAFATGGVTSTLNNCYTACKLTEGTGTDYCFTFCRGTYVANNCYYVNAIGEVQGTQVTEEQVASGALCYKLNGDQSNITWTQTIGTDRTPQAGTGSQRVYASGTVRCDGAELEDNPLTYTNTESYPDKPDHKYGTDGICTVCGMTDPNAVKQNEEGFYLIENAEQMYWLNLKVQEGATDLKVLLTDDIDLNDGFDPDLMIGTESRPFKGIFDGGGHTITYDYTAVTSKWRGLFAFIKDATIRNLRVQGSAYVTQIHYGALMGRADGTILVENVVTDVNITGAMNQVTGDAGMVGANYADITFNNCATLGEMGYAQDGMVSSMYSSFSGWSDGNSRTTLNNCFTACRLTEGTSTSNCFTLTHSGGTVTLNNCYYLHTVGRAQGTAVTEEQMAGGELCYMLNGDQSQIAWYQNIEEDETPVPDATHLRVYGAGKTFMNITDEASFREFVSIVIDGDRERYEETIAQKSLIETYLEALEALSDSPDIDTFMAGYKELDSQRQSIQSCATAYAAYIAKVEETKRYLEEHPDLDNEKSQALEGYLTELDEPSEDFPNGSALYILDNLLLNEEQITAETALIDQKLVEAITFTPAVGTEITMLLTNADLSSQFDGWEGQLPTGWGTSETSTLYAAECLSATMDMHQTLTGLPNGIYELQVNGAFRPTPYTDFYNVNYAATLYANGIHNYFQTNIEDMIDKEDAIDGVNCNITGPVADFAVLDEDGELAGYTMQGIVSCCNAFQAGRYQNSVLCKVTDGTLTVGIRQPGTGLTRDWLGFGNIRVFYYGQPDEAAESLDRVLASQSDRASTILNDYEFDFTDNYAAYPNFSQALKDELQQTLEAVATATEPEAKYQLIEKFSSLFLQIYECKQAYVTLMDKTEEVNNLLDAFSSILSEDEFNELDDLYTYLINGYIDGTMSAEEALAVDPKSHINFFPDEEDGYYLLRTPKDLFVFASLVKANTADTNAKLLADIDLRETDFTDLMIGTEEAPFGGIFDGLGHTITYHYEGECVIDKWRGLFACVDGATIRNLRVEGEAFPTNIHFGALIGVAYGTVLVEKVVTNVHITGDHSGVTGDAGMLGANYADITFTDCATLGEMGNPGSSMYSSYSGWSHGDSRTTLNNCYTACTFTEGTGTDHCFTLTHGSGKNTFNNCYYLNQIGTAQGKQMSEEQFRSGEVCYKLNGDQSVITWYQTIGEDAFPVLDESHQIVILEDGKYIGADAIAEVKADSRQQASGIYDLSGRKVADTFAGSTLPKGIYIVGQKKILVK